jgi:hypothetical protein
LLRPLAPMELEVWPCLDGLALARLLLTPASVAHSSMATSCCACVLAAHCPMQPRAGHYTSRDSCGLTKPAAASFVTTPSQRINGRPEMRDFRLARELLSVKALYTALYTPVPGAVLER